MPIMETGLGNQAMLAKIDKLRELNIGSTISLPQLVVVGDQSSGKSSVLESLTGFSFPRAPGLCTRYATQITCCRDPIESTIISIIPRPDADEDLKAKLAGFQRSLTDFDIDELADVFHEANLAMGIRMTTDDQDSSLSAFSEDILKIEISGPDQNHLTVIDVPGIFRLSTPGLTTDTDIALVENMVKRYMSNTRTIILAVIPCNVDIATQGIVKLAEAADPDGTRTMGVLTKPDLATEVATRAAVIDLVRGKRSNLKLGYYVVKNRSADDNASTLTQRAAAEKVFFAAPPWASRDVSDRCGTTALKERLRHLLMKISKQEFPKVKADIEQRLRRCQQDLETMGLARSDQYSQRLYLGNLAARFQEVTQAALNGHYASDAIFKSYPDLKLITRMIQLHTVFSQVFGQRAHMRNLDSNPNDESFAKDKSSAEDESLSEESSVEDESPAEDEKEALSQGKQIIIPSQILMTKYPELHDIILIEEYKCPQVESKPTMDHIKKVFESSRGPDLGTFSGTILATIFQEQSEKWEPLTLSHISNAIALVHDYIFQLLCRLCPEEQVRDQLWNILLVGKLSELYHKAMGHARFLLAIERGGWPSTFNHYFNTILQEKRAERLAKSMEKKALRLKDASGSYGRFVPLSSIKGIAENKANEEQVCEDILDTFVSYYKVARKRFIDVVYQQVICHLLLYAEESPLKAFGPNMIMRLDEEQLELIAGEDEESKRQRLELTRDVESLKGALKVLRT